MEINLIKDIDFGVIPGTKNNTLYKSGAIKICQALNINVMFEVVESLTNTKDRYLDYTYKCILTFPDGRRIECDGNANSEDPKYKYLWVKENEIPADLNKNELKSKSNNWGKTYRVPNPDLFSLKNTMIKISQKRAMIGALELAMDVDVFFNTKSPTPGSKQNYQSKQDNSSNKPQSLNQPELSGVVTSIASKIIPDDFKDKIKDCNTEDEINTLRSELVKDNPAIDDSQSLRALISFHKDRVNKKININ